MSLDEHSQSPQGQQNYQTAPPQRGTSGLAIAGLIFAFVIAPLGFILSLIAVFKTGAGRAKGRGLAIAGIIVSVLIIGGGVAIFALVANSTVADPGCVAGKAAVLDNSTNPNAASFQTTIDGLNSAAAKAKNDDVRDATKALAADYTQLLNATKTGDMPAGIDAKLQADADAFDKLCSIGN